MKRGKIIGVVVVVIVLVSVIIYVNRSDSTIFSKENIVPYSPAYFPEDLVNWDPAVDSDINYNKATKDLVERKDMPKINKTANSDTKIMALSSMNPSTLGNISNGSNEFEIYNFSHWQYIDSLVMWGGSAQEGIIVPPSAYVTDAAHQNGVKVYGTIYFPPEVYGGNIKWVKDIMQTDESGNYIIADKLIEMCEAYNFDGWFINQETEGLTKDEAKEFEKFLKYFYDTSPDTIDIIWYDSMLENGKIAWQNELNEKNAPFIINGDSRVSNSMFLNFWWEDMTKSKDYANKIGVDPYDIYAGIDVEAEGTNTEIPWDGIFKGDNSLVSLGIYRPDATFKNASTYEEYEKEELKFWGDNKTNNSWPGIAHYIVGKTSIIGDTFTTNFNTGNGKKYAIDGEIKSEDSWNNLSLQDILPSWTWRTKGENNLNISYDYDDPYYGGSSLKIASNLKAKEKSVVDLYATDLKVNKDSIFNITYKQNIPLNLQLILTFDNKEEKTFDISDENINTWITKEVDLKDYNEQNITEISIAFTSNNNKKLKLNLGQLQLKKISDEKEPKAIKNLKIDEAYSSDNLSANIRFSFDSENEQGTINEFYKVEDNNKKYIGSTLNNNFYINDLKRDGAEETFEIAVVSKSIYGEAISEIYTFKWPEYPASVANFEVNKTYVSPGEEIQLINNSSTVTTNYEWTFLGANVETSQEKEPIISYDKPGQYSITLVASNSFTSDTYTLENIITVADDAKDITNIALDDNNEFQATGACTEAETIEHAFDEDLTTKWCDNADTEVKGFTIEFKEPKLVTGFEIDNASMGGEGSDYNTKAFTVSVSSDGEEYEEVYKKDNNIDEQTIVAINPIEAKSIKVEFNEPTQNGENVTRIYEFKVLGFNQ